MHESAKCIQQVCGMSGPVYLCVNCFSHRPLLPDLVVDK